MHSTMPTKRTCSSSDQIYQRIIQKMSMGFNKTYHEEHPLLPAHSPLYVTAFQAGTSESHQSGKTSEIAIYKCKNSKNFNIKKTN